MVLVLMAALALVVVLGVGFRKAGAALVWYDEIASILLAWLTYYGACLAALQRAHIGFPKVVESLPPGGRRAALVVRETVVIAFFAVAAWAGIRVLQVLGGTYLVSLEWMPARVTQSVIPIGAVLFIVAEALTLPERWRPAENPSAAAVESGVDRGRDPDPDDDCNPGGRSSDDQDQTDRPGDDRDQRDGSSEEANDGEPPDGEPEDPR